MPIKPLKAAKEVLSHDSRLDAAASETISYLMDLLYYGDFRIFQQVASADEFEYVNLVGAKGPSKGKKPLWLISTVATGHLPEPSLWQRGGGDGLKPFFDEEMGVLYGLGAAGGKIDFVCKVLAASSFSSEELNRPLYVIGLFGEEARATGLRSVLDLSGGEGGTALVSAPTNLALWKSHPGLVALRIEINRELRHRRMPPMRGIFKLKISGKSAHAQWPGLGKNALDRGLEVLSELRGAGDIRVLSISTDPGANRIPGRCELIVATSYESMIPFRDDVVVEELGDGVSVPFPIDGLLDAWTRAKGAINDARSDLQGLSQSKRLRTGRNVHFGELISDRDSIAGTVSFWVDKRGDAMDIARKVAAAVQGALPKGSNLDVAIQVIQDRPAFARDSESTDFLSVAKSALDAQGIAPIVAGGRVTTDAGLLESEGIESYAFGPGSSGAQLYRDDEGIPAAHIEATYRFYVDLIRRWCLKPR